jgi:hypothetical protein
MVMEAKGRDAFNLAQAAYEEDTPVGIVKPFWVRGDAGAMDPLANQTKPIQR